MSSSQLSPAPQTASLLGVQILGTGSYVPDRVVSNEDLRELYGFEPEWIVGRTGIHERRFAAPHQATSDLCLIAAQRALAAANVDPSEIDLIIVGTMTPDMSFPSTACLLQDRLKLSCAGFDLQAACAGFIYALIVGCQFVKAGTCRRVLVIGGDTNSRVINPHDPKSYPLFGDGAGAVVIGPGDPDQGMVAYQFGADGSGGDLLNRPACGSRLPPSVEALEQGLQYLNMDGRAVFKWAVRMLADSTTAVLNHADTTVDQVRWFILHQANVRILHAATDVLNINRDNVFKNLDKYGNTSGGSIPIALDEVVRSDGLKRGDLMLTSGFGAGLTWGTALWRW